MVICLEFCASFHFNVTGLKKNICMFLLRLRCPQIKIIFSLYVRDLLQDFYLANNIMKKKFNYKMVLTYLIPRKISLDGIPSKSLLEEYDLHEI
jgi:hypothetical protein